MDFKLFKNTVEPTQTEVEARFWDSAFASLGLGAYSDVIMKLCISPIFDELKKVEFYSTNPAYEAQTKAIVNFLNTRYSTIYKYLFKKGYCAVKINTEGRIVFDNFAIINVKNEYEKEINNPLSVMSFDYDFFGQSSLGLLNYIFGDVNTGMTAQRAITKILGQFTIFNKEIQKDNERVVALSDNDRLKFVNKFNMLFSGSNVGTAVDFTNANLKRDTILFPLEKLQIREQTTFSILLIAGTLNVPYDLIPITGKSTYANQDSAREYLRNNTVSGIAENMLELGKKILGAKSKLIPKSAIDFRFIDAATIQQPITPIQTPTV